MGTWSKSYADYKIKYFGVIRAPKVRTSGE